MLTKRFDNALYLFKDLGAHGRDPYLVRQLRDISELGRPTVLLIDAEPLPRADPPAGDPAVAAPS